MHIYFNYKFPDRGFLSISQLNAANLQYSFMENKTAPDSSKDASVGFFPLTLN